MKASLLLSASCAAVVMSVAVVVADKDGDYYYPGMSNPNTKNAMYWKDSINVLQDLDQFESLYIKYHGCVWTKYGTRYGSGQNYDEQGADQDDADDEGNNGCGGWGGEYFWYMGRTQCFKANVAYSLYGILKDGGDSSKEACRKANYINSFFTTFGVESFTGPLGLGTDNGYNSQCTAVEPQDGEGGGEDNYYEYAAADDDYLDDEYEFYNYQAYTSYGTGCSDKGKFVLDQYSGAFCHGRNYQETLDTMDTFNSAIESQECTQIYADGDGYEEPQDEDGDGYEFDDMSAVYLLSFSKSCSLRQYPQDCPDPYGLKRKYANAMERAFAFKTGSQRNLGTNVMVVFSYIFLALGLICWVLSYLILNRNKETAMQARAARKERAANRRRARTRSRSHSRSRSRSQSKSPEPAGPVQQTMEKASSAMSDFSNKSWTSFGSAQASGGGDKSPEGSPSRKASRTGSRLGKFFGKKNKTGELA